MVLTCEIPRNSWEISVSQLVESTCLSKSANNQSWPRPFWVKDQKSIFLKGNLNQIFKDDLGQGLKQPRSD